MAHQEAHIESAILRWALERSALPLVVIAKRVGVKPERIEQWLKDERKPTICQLRALARVCGNLSLAVFFLPEPPRDFSPLKDFRRLANAPQRQLSPELLTEYRSASERRLIALELFDDLGETPPTFSLTTRLAAPVPQTAAAIRQALGITYDIQRRWRSNNEAFNAWRGALEQAGVLVFQATDISVAEMRGLSISERPLPTVVVNRKDAYAGRIFSAAHELTHIMLRNGGLCDMRDDRRQLADDLNVEIFCNAVAGEVVVAGELLMAESVVREHRELEWSDEDVARLARIYSTSKEVVLRRLLTMHRTTEEFYRSKRDQYIRELEEQQDRQDKKRPPGFMTPDAQIVSTAGKWFVTLGLDAFHQGRITASTLSDYFGVRLKHLSSIEDRVQMR